MRKTSSLLFVTLAVLVWSCGKGNFSGNTKQSARKPATLGDSDSTTIGDPTSGPTSTDKKQKIDLSFGEGMICGEPSPGFGGKVYQLPVNTPMLPDISKMTSLGQIEALNLNVAPRAWTTGFPGLDKIGVSLQEWFGIQFLAKLEVPVDGRYEFRTNSDDGSKLFVDNAIVVDNDGTHPPTVMSGSADLKKGNVPLKVEWFQGPKTQIALQVYWKKPGSASWEIIPSNVIKHRKDCKLREIGKFP